MKVSVSEPGLVVSGVVHAALLLTMLVAFSRTASFEDAQETVPVQVVTDQQFNEIMKGEKTAPPAPKPAQRVQKQSDTPDPKPPAETEAKEDVPTPPPPLKHQDDPGQDDRPETKPTPTPPLRTAELPPTPPTPPAPPVKPVPTPPPEADRPAPQDAEAVDPPKPPQRPKPEKAQVTPPLPPLPPMPPRERPTPPKQEARLDPKAIEKLIQKEEKAASRPKSGEETDQKQRYNSAAIARLLSHEPPGQKASTGHELSKTASLGSPTANAPHMSPSLWGQLDGMMQEQYKQCWSYLGLGGDQRYIPQIKVEFQSDGSLAAQPALLNPPSDPALRSLADSAMRAVRRCNPLKIPPQFAPYYQQWKSRILRFDPEEMQG